MKNTLIFLFLLIILSAQALAINYDEYKQVETDISVGSDFTIASRSEDYSIKYVNVDLTFYPRETKNQKVSSLKFEPSADIEEGVAMFEWINPKPFTYSFNTQAEVIVTNDFVKIKKKIPFPMTNIPESIIQYTEPTSNIDSNDQQILLLASEIASGQNDAFVVTHDIANWIENNIEYSLDSLTAESSQKASWVMRNRKGVCDEITTLFMAMVRSIGIPARYVSGVAYTNYDDKNNWGPHAWAEVYFPEYGWVPFDVTYKQLGKIDPSHIVLKYSLDSDESSTDYEWKSWNVDIETAKLDINVDQTSAEIDTEDYIDLNVEILKPKIGFGSFNLIETNVKNLKPYYYSTFVSLAHIHDITIFDNVRKHILLKPNEEKKIFWKIKTNSRLSENYIYTIPVLIYSRENVTAREEFISTADSPVFTNDVINDILRYREIEDEKVYSREIEIKCFPVKREYYEYEDPLIQCSIYNKGNTLIEDLEICINTEDKCRIVDLGITQRRKMNYSVTGEQGLNNYIVTAKNDLVSKAASVDLNILDTPNIVIDEIFSPESVVFNQEFNISFLLKKSSESNPKNVLVNLKIRDSENEWTIADMQQDERFILTVPGKILDEEYNDAEIFVEFYDLNGEKYEQEEFFMIKLENVTFFQKIYIIMGKIGSWLGDLF